MIFSLWLVKNIDGLPQSTIATIRLNIVVFGLLFSMSVALDAPKILNFLTSAPIIMSVAAAWVFIGTFFLAMPGEILRLPVTTFVIVVGMTGGILASWIGCIDNHSIRSILAGGSLQSQSIPIDVAYNNWYNNITGFAEPKEPVPLVLIATAGGASRAAFWTTKVLSQIEQDHPGFHKYVFAISSVSGGSLGAAVYRTMLNDVVTDNDPNAGDWRCMGKATKRNLVQCGLEVIDDDFLVPTFLTGLYADLAQRFLPGNLFPDRAAALERAWEESWKWTMPDSKRGLGSSFHSLWSDNSVWLPALIINGTSEKTGRRILTSNLEIKPDYFVDAIDFFKFFSDANPKSDLTVSTAAHNSARFPYIDAAGTLLSSQAITDRIVDGGYFENFGAGSIYDLLRALIELKGTKKVKFFVIQISSDPEFKYEPELRDIEWKKPLSLGLNVASDVTSPPVALFNTGSALGFRATQLLSNYIESVSDDKSLRHYAHFRLNGSGEVLSWVLSRKSIELLNDEWDSRDNILAYNALCGFMSWCGDRQEAIRAIDQQRLEHEQSLRH
jgi:hypothetical protein